MKQGQGFKGLRVYGFRVQGLGFKGLHGRLLKLWSFLGTCLGLALQSGPAKRENEGLACCVGSSFKVNSGGNCYWVGALVLQ